MHQITFKTKHTPAPSTKQDPRWNALNAAQAAMGALGLRDRDIAVLRGLLTFIQPERWLEKLMVHASNKTLQTRCDGIDERTLRRRLTRLCEVGLIVRHQSPNRKRYVIRDEFGNQVLSYGFDLSPLRENLIHLQSIADEQRTTDLRIKVLKAVLRDRLFKLLLSSFPSETEAIDVAPLQKLLRQKVAIPTLEVAILTVDNIISNTLDSPDNQNQTPKTSDSVSQIDRDIQSSKKEYIEESYDASKLKAASQESASNNIALDDCIDAAKVAMDFSLHRPRTWEELAHFADQLAPAIGIQQKQMLRTKEALGQRGASLAILGLVEALGRIREPSRYLNILIDKARKGCLDLVRMFRSLTVNARFPAGNQSPLTA